MATPDKNLVLLVDDTEVNLYNKRRILDRAGFVTMTATTGADALRLVREWKPRLVVLDVRLPDMDGWAVCKQIKSDPATASVLVLQVSATFVSEADTVRALEGGADACLTEPFEAPVLVATVRALLRARAAEDALRDALARAEEARSVAEAANRTKDEFLAMLSHELRTPLGTILTSVTLLRAGRLGEPRTGRVLETIERNARLQTKLIEDLLDVSRIISGKIALEIAPIDTRYVIDAALDPLRHAAEAKGVQVTTAITPSIGVVSADAHRLQQVVGNLLSNALKFTPPGGRIDVRIDRAESQLQIAVADTGKGIEPEFLSRIFERFEQVDSSTTRTEGGLGLGLAIARHLAELHGGTLRAESAGLGQGATFIVTLPLPALAMSPTEALGPAAFAPSRLPIGTDGLLDGVRVLAVDDELDSREAITLVLEHCGARVREAASVEDALRALTVEVPDVIVSDIGMPREDGFSLIRQVRGSPSADLATVPALALTAYGTLGDRRRILACGFQACLTKPVAAEDLAAEVARLARKPLLAP